MFALHVCLPLLECIVGLLSLPDKNKHGKLTTVIVYSRLPVAAFLLVLTCVMLIPGYNLFSGGNL